MIRLLNQLFKYGIIWVQKGRQHSSVCPPTKPKVEGSNQLADKHFFVKNDLSAGIQNLIDGYGNSIIHVSYEKVFVTVIWGFKLP
jgi:hypothetical protein